MKLDSKIRNRNYIFDCFNAEDAVAYIGEECYMTNDLELFKDLNNVFIYRLDRIDDNSFFYNYEEDEFFNFCLPVSLIERKETSRPFTLEEFQERFKVGDIIVYRAKNSRSYVRTAIISAVDTNNIDSATVFIGTYCFTLVELYNGYELQTIAKNSNYNWDWIPFGVVETNKE